MEGTDGPWGLVQVLGRHFGDPLETLEVEPRLLGGRGSEASIGGGAPRLHHGARLLGAGERRFHPGVLLGVHREILRASQGAMMAFVV